MILKMEMSQDNIKNSLVNTTAKLTDDLFRLLQVREKNEAMAKDWLLFLNTTPKFNKLTPGEIYQAFKMAMARELRDSKNEEINLLPELSINTTGKVLSAYLEWKRTNNEYQLAKDKIRKMNQNSEPNDLEKLKIRNAFLYDLFQSISSTNFDSSAWLLWLDEKKELTPLALKVDSQVTIQVKKRLYRIQNKKYLLDLEIDVKSHGKRPHHVELLERAQMNSDAGKMNVIVQNRCRAIVLCHFLKRIETFQEFKLHIDGLE